MKKIIFIVLLVVAIGGVGAFVLMRGSDNDGTMNEQITAPTEQQTEQIRQITANEVAQHTTKTDCWTIINGKVYDITSYIPRHPGGGNILSACGTDGTAFFNGQQAGQNGGRNNHSGDSRAESELAKLQIGVLAN
jgi:cytochrome b involved in lipid metabolism